MVGVVEIDAFLRGAQGAHRAREELRLAETVAGVAQEPGTDADVGEVLAAHALHEAGAAGNPMTAPYPLADTWVP